jgi:hypothetical protein
MYAVLYHDEFTYAEMTIAFPLKILTGTILANLRCMPCRPYTVVPLKFL